MASDKDKQNDVVRLSEIRDKIGQLADAILHDLAPFVAGQEAELAGDIEKMHQGCLLIKQKLAEFSVTQEFPEYLTKVRHDLRNCVNVISGYAEMVVEELQNKQQVSSAAQFAEMLRKVGQILSLISEIKGTALQPATHAELDSPLSTEGEGESKEFRDFKAKFSILIVDDNKESCQILNRYLGRIGYQNTQMANGGPQALELLDKNPVDLVLLDIDMPQMTGIEVLQRLKERIIQQSLMVLMISAVDTLENTVACIKLGAEDFLPKPFNADLLRVRIGSCVEKKWFINSEKNYLERLEFEKLRYEGLMRAVFPSVIVNELAETGTVKPANYSNVAVMFADVVSFTSYCDTHQPPEILQNLQMFAEMCESAALRHKLEKIKTIGDCFLGTAGMLIRRENPVLDCIRCAKELLANSMQLPPQWQLRIGIHFGSLIGGIVGHRQYQFDIWGDVVNTAARIQSQAAPNTLCMSVQAWEQVRGLCECKSLGMRAVRGKAPIEIFEYVSGGE